MVFDVHIGDLPPAYQEKAPEEQGVPSSNALYNLPPYEATTGDSTVPGDVDNQMEDSQA